MPQQTNNTPASTRKWTILCGGAVMVVIAVLVVGMFLLSRRPDPREAARLAAEQLTRQVKGLVDGGEFDAAASAIESFLDQHPDAPDLPRLWALKIVSHRKGGDLTKALLAVAGMAEKFQGRGGDLCDVGSFLVGYECYQDAAKAFELATEDASVRQRACYQAAMCNYRLGRFAMAMKYIDVASVLEPNDPEIAAALKRIEDVRFVADK